VKEERMQDPQDAQYEVYEALRRHFDRSADRVNVEQITEMTGLGQGSVENALRVLHQARRVNGITVAEAEYPIWVTSINYD
jgi:hypothetical protein